MSERKDEELRRINAAMALGDRALPPIGTVMASCWATAPFVEVVEVDRRHTRWPLKVCGMFAQKRVTMTAMWVGWDDVLGVAELPDGCPPFADWERQDQP